MFEHVLDLWAFECEQKLTLSCPGTELEQKITLTVNISVNIGPIEII